MKAKSTTDEKEESRQVVISDTLKILVAVSVLLVVVFSVAQIYITGLDYPEGSTQSMLQSFALSLIPNFITILLVFTISYVYLRRIQNERVKIEAQELSRTVHKDIDPRLDILEKKIDEVTLRAELGSDARFLGVAGITGSWTDFIHFKGKYGKILRDRIEAVTSPATWYFVTHNPHAFLSWGPMIEDAAKKSGINIQLVFHSAKSIKDDQALKAQREWLSDSSLHWQDKAKPRGLKYLEDGISVFCNLADKVERRRIANNRENGYMRVYESTVPHFHMAFIVSPGEQAHNEDFKVAPTGTFGFVHLYPMFAENYERRCALFLDSPGDIVNYYYFSTLNLFTEGLQREYLREIKVDLPQLENPKLKELNKPFSRKNTKA